VHVSMTTSAGKAGKPNEDFAGAVPGAAVLLDGAGIPGTESICSQVSPGIRTVWAARCSAGYRVTTGETSRRSSPPRSAR
jgi:hypothetical protein